MINISSETWEKEENFESLVLWDAYVYTRNQEYISNCIADKTFCDCKGNFYKAFDVVAPTSFWRKALSFLPNIYKTEIKLKRTGDAMSVDELREFMLERLRAFPPDDFYNKIKSDLKDSDSFIKLIFFGIEN